MRVAALYDIHGNLPALEAVLHDVRAAEADLVVVGGDVVPGPMPREVIGSLLDLDIPVQFVRGNCDRDVVALRSGQEARHLPENVLATMRWTADQIDDDMARTMAAWPATTHLHMSSLGHVLFCHATPRNDTEIFTRLTPENRLAAIFEPTHAAVVVCGHTHMQFDRKVGTTRVVNAGSVGMPFQEPGAYWLLLGPDVELRRTEYPLDRAAERIRATSYPQAAQFAERNVLHPPSERETLESFSRVELR